MYVNEVMSKDVKVVDPGETVSVAAQSMAELDVGALPVGEGDHLVGMITDRDIVVRGIAQQLDPRTTAIRDVMSPGISFCFEDEEIDEVAQQMAGLQVRRLPVLNREKRLVGVVSLGDLAQDADSRVTGDALQGVSEGGPARASE
jgi:CBS domain-containing protein